VNSPWNRAPGARRLALIALALAASACQRDKPSAAGRTDPAAVPADPAQADANELGRELFEIVDRVMAYRSSHRNRLPTSLRQVGLDSLTPMFVRRLSRQGSDPLVTIAFRRPEGRVLRSCAGTSMVLENSALHDGTFDVTCELVAGGVRPFEIGR
jgi:hypothetical protein